MSKIACTLIIIVLIVVSDRGYAEYVNVFKDDQTVASWLILGPFPDELLVGADQPSRLQRAGLDIDFLMEYGGEADAIIRPETVVNYTDIEGLVWSASTNAVDAVPYMGVNLEALFRPLGKTDWLVAYAFCWVDSDKAREVQALFGSDDRAVVWINGEQVHRFDAHPRGVNPSGDSFPVSLREGRNTVLVKVQNDIYGWGFALRFLNQASYGELLNKQARRRAAEEAVAAELKAGGVYESHILEVGAPLPTLTWSQPDLVEAYFGGGDLRVRWFDRALNEVGAVEDSGRYAAYVEVDTDFHGKLRRGATYYAVPSGFSPWRYRLRVDLPQIAGAGIDRKVWEEQAEDLQLHGGTAYLDYIYGSAAGARMLAGLHDRGLEKQSNVPGDLPRWMGADVRDQEYHLRLKAKIQGWDLNESAFESPKKVRSEGPVLRSGCPKDAGFSDDIDQALSAIGKEWVEASGLPFTIVVARNGIVVHSSAYGDIPSGPVTRETPFDIASISKLITGILLMQFVDQGLISLDDPIGNYLPDFPVEGEKVITIRDCMMHMVGTDGHGNYGGLANPWFESQTANTLEFLNPGRMHHYNGLSLNLVARCLERVGGKSFQRLLHEHLYDPLGMTETRSFDASYGTQTSAENLALLAQMLLNKGQYGNLRFFSPETAEEMYPVRVGDLYPDCLTPEIVYGIGASWWNDKEGILTHGSATQSVLLVDFHDDLIITMTRPAGGEDYAEYWSLVERTIRRLRL